MKKRPLILLGCFIIMCLSGGLVAKHVMANDSKNVSITITKYALMDNQRINKLKKGRTQPVEIVTDNYGNQVQAVSDISYTVDLVEAKSDAIPSGKQPNTYEVVTGKRARHYQGRTDQHGVLTIDQSTGLTHGLYVVNELANEKLAKTMDPVIVNLPAQVSARDDNDNHIYIFPKSSFGDADNTDINDVGHTATAGKSKTVTDPNLDIELPSTDGVVKHGGKKGNVKSAQTVKGLVNYFPPTGMAWVELLMRLVLALACFTLVGMMFIHSKVDRTN
ncbi:hypothetical protein EQG49_04955 [Periweissella cryptocerci]|uniref:Uncharacterized protein n=1 Tax=Periweissella cryptocerci TaxID=2506420 RepID=A0A4P6YSZ0_9LACO|nr:hypothetical protein [Periweissella cryptocerci]QBO35858.1 hypothetical protein EQG49_04955 [Periweissella cryptocerci]